MIQRQRCRIKKILMKAASGSRKLQKAEILQEAENIQEAAPRSTEGIVSSEPEVLTAEPEILAAGIDTDGSVSFQAESFSIFAIVGTTIEKTFVASDGRSYKISVTYGPEAGVPEGAKLEVSEILPGEESTDDRLEYDEYVAKAEEALGWKEGSASYARLFDIRIVDENEEKVEIAAPVEVKIELADKDNEYDTQVVHFPSGQDEGNPVNGVSVQNEEVCFMADGFSVYSVVEGPKPYNINAETADEIADLTDPDGFCLTLNRSGGPYYFTNSIITHQSGNMFNETKNAADADIWYFERVEGQQNQFKICTIVDGARKYVKTGSGNGIDLSDENGADIFEISVASSGTFYIKLKGVDKWLQHSGSGGGIRFWTDKKNAANSKIIMTYSSSLNIPDDPYGLNGKTTGLMNHSDGTSGKALMAAQKGNNALTALSMMVRTNPYDQEEILYVAKDSDISQWTFHSVEKDLYNISVETDAGTKYLKVTSSGIFLADEDEATPIQVIPGKDSYAGKIRLTADGKTISYDASNNKFVAANDSGTDTKASLSFTELSDLEDDDFISYSATKVSVSDETVTNGSRVIVYTRKWNEETKRYEFYAIDHDGSLVRCYESGDSIEWVGGKVNSLLWNFTEYYWEGTGEPNYYYDLKNPYSGKFLAPRLEVEDILSDTPIGVNMEGRRYGDYYSTIVAWDDPYYAYSGLKAEDGKVVSCPYSEAEDFYFAIINDPTPEGELTEVPTVDHISNGITMKMVNFGSPYVKPQGIDTTKEQHDVMGDSSGGAITNPISGLLSTDIDPATGYPTAVKTDLSLGQLFAGGTEVNHLFLQSIYSGTGYYEFDSAQNFASLEGGNFKVYKELGTYDGSNKNSLKHGQFFPYNSLNPSLFASVNDLNMYTATLQTLPDSDPRKYEPLYLISKPDYYFGMEIEASFEQTPSGLDAWDHDIIYEFTGDDDFWLYVDGELVIDLGGIHSALPGSVNFRTGEVSVNGTRTTLYEVLKKNYQTRGMSADEITAKLAEIFEEKTDDNGNPYYTFTDYSSHTMRIFFMERGAGASNLHMRFNLSSVKKDQFILNKKISGTDQTDYKLAEYAYQIWYEVPGENEGDPTQWLQLNNDTATSSHKNVVYQNTNIPVKYSGSFTPAGGVCTYSDVYFLTSGQNALITVPENTISYKIIECGVNTQVYDEVKVNGGTVTGTDTDDTYRKDFETTASAVVDRKRVAFDNHVSDEAKRILTITKKLYDVEGNLISDDPTGFNYRLYLGGENVSDPETAALQDYYVKNDLGEYCRWDVRNQKFVSLGKNDYSSLTDDEKQMAVFQTSTNGSISKIPAEYKVEVRDLLVGTKFKVEERSGEIPEGYSFIEYVREAGSYIVEDGDTVNSGIIRSNESPAIEVHNRRGFGLTVKKNWSDASFMDYHGDIYFAVYVKGTMLPGSVRRLKHPAKSVYYYWDELASNASGLEDYVIREVTLNGVSGTDYTVDETTGEVTLNDGCEVTPISEGGTLRVVAKAKEESTEDSFDYSVGYSVGRITGAADNVRTDTVTNSRHGIRLVKTDWEGRPLAGAVFSLKDANGNLIGDGEYTSDEEGEITIAYVNVDTEYTLEETETPAGYHGLETPLKFVMHTWGLQVTQGNWDTYVINQASGDKMAELRIKNRELELKAVKQGLNSNGTQIPLGGAVFSLHREVTDGTTTVMERNPISGYENLISEDGTGLIPKISEELNPGVYYLVEKEAPEGYIKSQTPARFSINKNGEVTLDPNEDAVLTSSVEGNKQVYTLTVNIIETIDITVKKRWFALDEDLQLPVQAELHWYCVDQHGNEVNGTDEVYPGGTVTLSGDNNWEKLFSDLPSYRTYNQTQYRVRYYLVENGVLLPEKGNILRPFSDFGLSVKYVAVPEEGGNPAYQQNGWNGMETSSKERAYLNQNGSLVAGNASDALGQQLAVEKKWFGPGGTEVTSQTDDKIISIQIYRKALFTDKNGTERAVETQIYEPVKISKNKIIVNDTGLYMTVSNWLLTLFESSQNDGYKQLPQIGPYYDPNTQEYYRAAFEYSFREMKVEDLQGNDITDQWRAETSVDEVRTIIKNKPHSPGSEVTILKTGPDSSQTLPGAHFALYADDYYLPDGTTVNPEAQPMDGKSNLVSGDSGLISLGLLEDGTYYLAETQPPDGYQILSRPVTILVNSQNTQTKLIDGKDYPLYVTYHLYENGGGEASISSGNSGIWVTDLENGGYSYQLTVTNNPGYVLPSTGGRGTMLFYILGSALICLAGTLLLIRKRREF